MCIEVFPVLSEQDCWKTRRPTRGSGPAASVSYFRWKLASRITSSFSPGSSRWASVSAGLLPAWHSAALSENVCIINPWSVLRDWCISVESLIYMVWLQIKKMDFVLAYWNHSLETMFETKFLKWSVVYLLSDINLCLYCWDALSLDMQIPCSLTSQPPPGLCSKLTSHVRFYNLFPCLLLCCTCHHLRHLISCLLSPSQNCMHCEGRNPVCLCIAVFSVPREDVTHKKWMFSEWMEGRVQEAE